MFVAECSVGIFNQRIVLLDAPLSRYIPNSSTMMPSVNSSGRSACR
jgi:hypothetical protein